MFLLRRAPRFIVPCLFILLLAASPRAEVVLVKPNEYLTLREKPQTGAKALQKLYRYEPVRVSERKGEWAAVTSSSGKKGWVLARYLHDTAFVTVDPKKLAGVGADKLHARQGPGTNFDIFYLYDPRFPLYVLGRDPGSGWLEVLDFDGDRAWVSPNMVCIEPYVITQLDRSNSQYDETRFRDGPGAENRVVFTSERGVIYQVLEEKSGWLKVRHEDKSEGWVSRRIVFGRLDGETDHLGFPKKISPH